MVKLAVIATVVLLSIEIISIEGNTENLTYLCKLLNVTLRALPKILRDFTSTDVPPENVKVLQYFPSNVSTLINSTQTLEVNKSTKIIIHGWSSTGKEEWVQEMARSLHQIGRNFNVLAIDWSIDASKNYIHAAGSVRSIGYQLAHFIYLNKLLKVHIIAHSLGAHVAGFAGKKFQELSGRKIYRISAMDPAGPLFESSNKENRVDKSDAGFVDVIHTQIGIQGLIIAIGHVDCYVNGGIIQPKCVNLTSTLISSVECGHSESHFLYRQSIRYPERYKALKCDNLISFQSGSCDKNPRGLVGYGAIVDSQGNYYINIDKNDNVVKP